MNAVNNSIAGAAVASPIWLPSLQQVSEAAGLLLPIAGCVWFAIQIGFFLWSKYHK